MTTTWQAIEDNGGGLHLAVFDGNDCVYFASGFEFRQGELTACIEALNAGENPIDAGWESNADDPQAVYNEITGYEYGWAIVADECAIDPDVMGAAAKREFGIDE